MHILGLIPARGGSKGVPGKNKKQLNGQALINYSIAAGLSCSLIDKIVVSTDDPAIATIAKQAGAEVPFLRPDKYATDQSPTIDTIIHALEYFLAKGIQFDAVCLLQPTVPFRNEDDLTAMIEKFKSSQTDSCISVRAVPHIYNPQWVYQADNKGLLNMAMDKEKLISRRQDLPPAYHRDGSVYLCKSSVILEQKSLYGNSIGYHIMERSPNINIDTMDDWQLAENWSKAQK